MNDSPATNFAPTRWTLVLRARGESTESRTALSELCEAYYQPILRFLRSEGRDEDTARELAHEFFCRILGTQGFGGVDPERGRFRSYLLGALKHFLTEHRAHNNRLKRGGGMTLESLDKPAQPDKTSAVDIPCPATSDPDTSFDREWALTIMERALAELQKELIKDGKSDQFEILKTWLMGDTTEISQAEAARRLGISEGAVKVTIHRLRKRFREAVRAEITHTLPDPRQVDEELRLLVESLM